MENNRNKMKAITIIATFLSLGFTSFGQKLPKTDTLGHDLKYDTIKAAIMYFDTGKIYIEHHIFGYVAKAQGMPDTYNLYFDHNKKRRIDRKFIMYVKEGAW